MGTILTKKEMTEEDIKLQFITPALTSRWPRDKITMETKITDGKILLRRRLVTRQEAKKVDYLLYLDREHPIAVVEAKDNRHSVSYGLQQAKLYAEMLDLPFAYSSNGDGFTEYDYLTGLERDLPLDGFPTEAELTARWRREVNQGKGLSDREEQALRQPYYITPDTFSPRYYQRIAVNRTVDAIARGRKRILLVMATGTGKTYTAFQIVYRLLSAGLIKKVLYLADRNILVDQTIQQDFAPLRKVTHKIRTAKEDPVTLSSYQVYFSLYQQLVGDDDEEHFRDLFRPDFFDLVIVDECHRGSAKEDSRWRRILDYFCGAAQIGMTATPKETRYVSNIDYFGEPLYTYSLNSGIEDGYLAPFRIRQIRTNIGDGWRPKKGQRDLAGELIPDRLYTNRDYDTSLILLDRTREVARRITEHLKASDRMAKTIVFCPTEDAAERMRHELANLNADMMKKYPDYVVRITANDKYGKSRLDYFISVSAPTPVIAVTSQLLSTGVDCKMVKLIVIDKWINSMTEFKQIIGRGTRLRADEGKTHFDVMDFRGVAHFFTDPDWDGPVEIIKDPTLPPPAAPGGSGTPGDPDGPKPRPIVDASGCRVEIIGETVSVYDPQTKLLRQESLVDYTKENIRGRYATLDTFIRTWSAEKKKGVIAALLLAESGIDLAALKQSCGMAEVDDFDFICHVAYGQKPLTRRERASRVKEKNFLSRYSGPARAVLEALLDKYKDLGIYEIEKAEILRLDPFSGMGKPARIIGFFGGKAQFQQALKELEDEIYAG